jgi:hypothetical protein
LSTLIDTSRNATVEFLYDFVTWSSRIIRA